MGLFIAHQIWGLQLKWNVFQFCLTVIQEQSFGHNFMKILFNVIILYTISRMVLRIIKQIYLSWKWNRIFQSRIQNKLTKQLNQKYGQWNTEIVVVEDDAFIALSMGLLRPRIIVSTRLFDMFSNKEILAILLHERYHCRHFDPLKAFLFIIFVDGMGYVPIIKAAAHYYKTCKELLADQYAVKQMGSEYYLSTVLLRLSNWGNMHRSAAGVYFADVAINYRILQVLNPQQPVRIPFMQTKPVILSISILLIMFSIVLGGCS
jgi:Zn-dependent protease with chaperone function